MRHCGLGGKWLVDLNVGKTQVVDFFTSLITLVLLMCEDRWVCSSGKIIF